MDSKRILGFVGLITMTQVHGLGFRNIGFFGSVFLWNLDTGFTPVGFSGSWSGFLLDYGSVLKSDIGLPWSK
jgi:hypothetical protein